MGFNQINSIPVLRMMFLIFLLASLQHSLAQKVPISFDAYHGYTATTKYLNDVAKAYPDITELLEIGRSTMDRPIHVLILTNKKTGTTLDAHVTLSNMRKENVQNVPKMKKHQGKPGQWISGSTHGNEYTGTEVCLYIIDKLIRGYNNNGEITTLLDKKVFYICPMVNPDGVYNSVELGIPQRYNSMKKDDDDDGRINEDGPDDINGDGIITQFRYKDTKGRYIIDDVDSRLMVRLGRNEETTSERWSVINEDIDNDSDGERGEDPEAGIDLNRNFPEVWFTDDGMQGGSGSYPTSAPETRALAEFFTNHTNILMAQNFHTSGGFTYRPLGTSPHEKLHPKDVAVYDMIMGKKYLELINEEVPQAWIYPDSLDVYKEALKKVTKNKYAIQRGYELPRGWRVSYNESDDRRYSFGMASDWMYMQYGVYATTTELWNPEKDLPDFPKLEDKDRRLQRSRALLKYQDDHYDGKYFINWKAFKHPELGEGEIGGWLPQYRRNNAFPGEPLLSVCEKHWQFELFRATLLPEVEISDVDVKVLYTTNKAQSATIQSEGDPVKVKKGKSIGKYRIVEITAKINNAGALATHIGRGSSLAGNRPDVVWLLGESNNIEFLQGTPYQKIGVLEGNKKIPGYKARPEKQATVASAPSPNYSRYRRFRRVSYDQPGKKQTGSTRTVKWLVAVEGTPDLKVVVASQKGGTKVKKISIK